MSRQAREQEKLMIVETHFALVDEILAGWKSRIGDDYAGYRNSCLSRAELLFALRDCDAEERHKLTVAAAFHDPGDLVGRHGRLSCSIGSARKELPRDNNLDRWTDEISLIIDMHHKLRCCRALLGIPHVRHPRAVDPRGSAFAPARRPGTAGGAPADRGRHEVVVLVDKLDRATLQALSYGI